MDIEKDAHSLSHSLFGGDPHMITRRNARLVLLVLCLALTVMPSIRTVSSTQAPGPMEASSTADTAEAAPAGSIICCSTKSGETSLIDIATGEVQNLTFSGSSIEISPDRKTLAYVDRREQLHVYYLDTGRDVRISDPEDLEKYGSPTFVSNDTIAYIKRNRTYMSTSPRPVLSGPSMSMEAMRGNSPTPTAAGPHGRPTGGASPSSPTLQASVACYSRTSTTRPGPKEVSDPSSSE